MKILVAEDNDVNRELIREVLEGSGYTVIECSNGEEALEKIAETSPDLVLLDIQMPVLDGCSVARRLRQDSRFRTLPLVALTAYAMDGDREIIMQAGFDGYLTKPLELAHFKEAIRRRLEGK